MRRLITVLALWLVSSVLFAQYTNITTGNSFNNPGSALIDSFIRSKMNQKMLQDSIKKSRKTAPLGAKATSFDYSKSIFKGNGARIFPDLVAQAAENISEADRKQLAVNLVEAINELEKQPGVKNNLAYSISLVLGISLKITKNVDPSDEDLEELAQAVSHQISADTQWSKMTDEQKQLMYENYLVNASIMIALLERKDADSLKAAKDQAIQCLNQFGITE